MRFLYRLLIVDTFITNKEQSEIDRLTRISGLKVNTTKGEFIFNFYKDTTIDDVLSKYVIEVDVPEGANSLIKIINNKIVIVLKIRLKEVDMEILSEVLFNIYLDKIVTIYK
jgi:hypothetical protein